MTTRWTPAAIALCTAALLTGCAEFSQLVSAPQPPPGPEVSVGPAESASVAAGPAPDAAPPVVQPIDQPFPGRAPDPVVPAPAGVAGSAGPGGAGAITSTALPPGAVGGVVAAGGLPPGVAAGPAPVETAASSGDMPSVDGRRAFVGSVSAAAVDMQLAVREARGWNILWQLVGQQAPGPLPADAMIVGVFSGPRPTSGYTMEIVNVTLRPDEVLVAYRENPPAPGAMVEQTVSAPYALQVLPVTEAPVRFVAAGG